MGSLSSIANDIEQLQLFYDTPLKLKALEVYLSQGNKSCISSISARTPAAVVSLPAPAPCRTNGCGL